MAINLKDGTIIISFFLPVEKYTDGIKDSEIETEIANYRIDYNTYRNIMRKIAEMAEKRNLLYTYSRSNANERVTITIRTNQKQPHKKLLPPKEYIEYLHRKEKYEDFLKSIENEAMAIIRGGVE